MIKTYEKFKEAISEAWRMKGWKIRVIRMDDEEYVRWAIQCDGTKYLRVDGFVN